ncbi:50S ribosomal protein L32 [bacterium]|nr:50S ribosomal protein L32 [bacterium]NCQ55497.1 50S ribosomal protein L32 [Candidatus Parcubacteria bacterium]NCS67508.1 50S ribosomal protein L32 [Candidatus Peregrinibacteria bacterium]NCS96327.1 50S ribosomal protein L32 [bacterium]
MSKKPVPKKQQAKSSTRSRHSKWVSEQRKKLEKALVLDKCPTTGETKLRHFASPSGMYKGRKVTTGGKDTSTKVKAIEA